MDAGSWLVIAMLITIPLSVSVSAWDKRDSILSNMWELGKFWLMIAIGLWVLCNVNFCQVRWGTGWY